MTSDYLSLEGRRRKAEMAELLTAAVARRRRRRRAARAGSVLAVVALAIWLLWPPSIERPAPKHDAVAHYEAFDFAVATGNRATIATWIVKPKDTSRFRIGDAELIDMLEQAGHESGILRVGAHVVLTQPFEFGDD